jgi:galacturan 1,4-alpha-galacturonidase
MLGPAALALLPVAAAAIDQLAWKPPHDRFPVAAAVSPSFEPRDVDVPPREHWEELAEEEGRTLCYLEPLEDDQDDAAAIAEALNGDCHKDGLVVLPGETYHMNTNITTMGLDNVHVNLYGRLLWSTNIEYWLSVSMPIGFQNQSTVWYFGGDNVLFDGHGVGTLDGNGQVWYDWAEGEGNLPHRPMMINWRQLTNSIVRRTRFVQSQMWTMTASLSKNLLFEDIYVNNTSNSEHSTLNTDGIDTIWSDNITLNRWDVTCGDDNVALKGNSSNIFVYDSVFHGGQGVAIGSLGQYNGRYEHIKNFVARNITMYNTRYAIYLKTWPGVQNGYPPNGGGGGLGHGENIVMEDIVLHGARTAPFWIWQCEHYEGDMGKDCNSSEFSFSDVHYKGVSGTMAEGVTLAASLRCSGAGGGCTNVTVEDFSVTTSDEKPLTDWYCANVHDYEGFECEPFPPEESGSA